MPPKYEQQLKNRNWEANDHNFHQGVSIQFCSTEARVVVQAENSQDLSMKHISVNLATLCLDEVTESMLGHACLELVILSKSRAHTHPFLKKCNW